MTSNLPIVDIATYLPTIVPSLGLVLGTNLFVEFLPDLPDTAVALFGYPGNVPEFTMGSGNLATALPCLEEARVQIVRRDAEGATIANEQALETIYRAVIQVTNLVIGGTNYERWEARQRPFFLMRDEKRRVFHAFNLSLLRTPN